MSDTPDNPIIQQGYLFSEAEYKLVSGLLTSCAEAAKNNGNHEIHRECQRIVVRMRDHVFAGAVPDETYRRHQERIQKAFSSGDQAASMAAIRDLTTTMLRMSSDPARAVSELLIGILSNSLQAQVQTLYASAMAHAMAKLQREREAFASDGWPDGEVLLEYLQSLFEKAVMRVRDGLPPFDDDDVLASDVSDEPKQDPDSDPSLH